MTEDDLRDWLDSLLRPLEFVVESGTESNEPKLEVLGYYVRRVRLSPIPILGKGLGVVAICRPPGDLSQSANACRTIIERLAIVANSRFPPIRKGRGLTIGITAILLTEGPLSGSDDAILASSLNGVSRTRAVPLGIFRVDLEREAVSFAIKRGPDGIFPETDALADGFNEKFRRFVPIPDFP